MTDNKKPKGKNIAGKKTKPKIKKKKKPRFNVLNSDSHVRVKDRWRKPRGTHNKKRMGFEFAGASPNIGYRNPKAVRGLHPCGLREVLVHNPSELEGLKEVAVRISAKVGAKKKLEIIKKAESSGLKVLNPGKGGVSE